VSLRTQEASFPIPRIRAGLHLSVGFLISLIICGLLVVPAHAQLASYVDEQGNLVFTNPLAPAPRAVSSKVAAMPSSSPRAANASTRSVAAIKTIPEAPMAPEDLDAMVQKTAQRYHVDPKLVRAVISAESNWNAAAVSSKGALGLMQLIPGTAQRLGVGNAFDPAQNVDAGVRYLSMLLERYNGDLNKALAAYNAGPGVVDRFGGVPNFPETRHYVQKVTATYFRPGSEPPARPSIYREVEADGRVVFTNE
jgi:soluble lytic murein transglycosylase-like protein